MTDELRNRVLALRREGLGFSMIRKENNFTRVEQRWNKTPPVGKVAENINF